MNKKQQAFLQLGLVIAIAIVLNVLAQRIFGHLDLTEDKRYTMTVATKAILGQLEDEVTVDLLMTGDFPAGFKRLQRSVTEMLSDFRSESGYITYRFMDPNEGSTTEINERVEALAKQGIYSVRLGLKDNEGTEEKYIYPYAVFNYRGKTIPVNFLEGNQAGLSPEASLNKSVSLLEYKFADAIQKLQRSERPAVLFLSGHGEWGRPNLASFAASLQNSYVVDTLNLDSVVNLPAEQVAALIIARPQKVFSQQDKFKIDQYIMNGGKVLWLIDRLNAGLDSMQGRPEYVPYDYPLDLDDQLFKYGVRLNANLVLDLQCSKIPLAVDKQGALDLFPWYYHLLAASRSNHPVVKNIDNVNLLFAGSIDTIQTKTPVKKTILLTSSEYSRIQFAPVRLNFEILRYAPEPDKFDKPYQPLAVLLEGNFPSAFENRVPEDVQAGLQQMGLAFKTESVPTKMLVVSDGDIIHNSLDRQLRRPNPVGFNPYDRQTYNGNKEFLQNALEYLLDDTGLIEARSREVKLRLLDTVKAKAEKTKWQLVNIGLPILLLGLFGWLYYFLRKRRYARM